MIRCDPTYDSPDILGLGNRQAHENPEQERPLKIVDRDPLQAFDEMVLARADKSLEFFRVTGLC